MKPYWQLQMKIKATGHNQLNSLTKLAIFWIIWKSRFWGLFSYWFLTAIYLWIYRNVLHRIIPQSPEPHTAKRTPALNQFYQCLLLASSRDKHFTSFTFSTMYINSPASVRWRLVVLDHSNFASAFSTSIFPAGITQCLGYQVSAETGDAGIFLSQTAQSPRFLARGSWEQYSKDIMEKFNLCRVFLNTVQIHVKFPVLWATMW